MKRENAEADQLLDGHDVGAAAAAVLITDPAVTADQDQRAVRQLDWLAHNAR
jgi:hypothetical protein